MAYEGGITGDAPQQTTNSEQPEIRQKLYGNTNDIKWYQDEIKKLEGLLELKEKERKELADLCIKKESIIESIRENMILGNAEEAFKIATNAIVEHTNSKK